MSPVNRAGSVSEISPRHSFLRKTHSSGLKSVFEKLRSRHGLLWTVGPTEEIKVCAFLYSSSVEWKETRTNQDFYYKSFNQNKGCKSVFSKPLYIS